MFKQLSTRIMLLASAMACLLIAQPANAQNLGQIIRGAINATPAVRPYVQPQQHQHVQHHPVQTWPQQPGYVQQPVQQQYYPPNWNPVVIDSGKQITGVTYDPFTGQVRVRSNQNKVRDSYFDPNRNNADPGSYHYVNRYETDAQGNRWHVTGHSWTTNGKPHGNLSRRRVSHTGVPGVIHDETENVAYSVQPGGNSNSNNTQQNRNQNWRQPTQQPQRTVQPRSSTPIRYSPF